MNKDTLVVSAIIVANLLTRLPMKRGESIFLLSPLLYIKVYYFFLFFIISIIDETIITSAITG